MIFAQDLIQQETFKLNLPLVFELRCLNFCCHFQSFCKGCNLQELEGFLDYQIVLVVLKVLGSFQHLDEIWKIKPHQM